MIKKDSYWSLSDADVEVPNYAWIKRDADGEGWFETLENETYSVKIILTIAHLDHDPGNSCLIKAWRSTSDFPRAPSRIAWPCKSSSINSACFGFTGYKTPV